MIARPVMERFIEKIDTSGSCWLWKSALHHSGYGLFGMDGRMQTASRVAYKLLVGPIPPDMCVLHACDNPRCVKPSHLFLGTQLENMRDMTTKGRNHETKKTHCPRGHAYTKLNTYLSPSKKGRTCRECGRIAQRAYQAKKKSKATSNVEGV